MLLFADSCDKLFELFNAFVLLFADSCDKLFELFSAFVLLFADSCDKLFELFNAFAAENTKKKPQVWPLQMMLLVLCPVSELLALLNCAPATDDFIYA